MSDEERDRYPLRFAYPVSKWVRWFAWRAVFTSDHGVIWMRFVYRRRMQLKDYLSAPVESWWQYVKEDR